MAFINKYLNIRMTASDLGKAKIYNSADCATPKLYLRAIAGGDHACGLVASSVNDPRKLCVIHSDTNALGLVTKTSHYVNAMSGATQYTLLGQLENRIGSGPNIQELTIAEDHTNHYFGSPADYIVDDISRLYSQYVGDYVSSSYQGIVSCHMLGGYYSMSLKLREDGVDGATLLSIGASTHDENTYTMGFVLPSPDGMHTVGFHIFFAGVGRIKADTYMKTKSMIESNVGK
jgi:hypothetical protein